MLSYIASISISEVIKDVCKLQNIMILTKELEKIDFLKYIKETKDNYNLIKYLVIDLSQLEGTEDEVVKSIEYFKDIYCNTRIIIIARGYDAQNIILTKLYDNCIYNIINNKNEEEIKKELIKCLSQEGLQAKDVKKFKKIEELNENKNNKCNKIFKVKDHIKKLKDIKVNNRNIEIQSQIDSSIYFFAIIIDAIKSLAKLICYIAIFILTSLGLTFLFNNELRNMIFQILGLQ